MFGRVCVCVSVCVCVCVRVCVCVFMRCFSILCYRSAHEFVGSPTSAPLQVVFFDESSQSSLSVQCATSGGGRATLVPSTCQPRCTLALCASVCPCPIVASRPCVPLWPCVYCFSALCASLFVSVKMSQVRVCVCACVYLCPPPLPRSFVCYMISLFH